MEVTFQHGDVTTESCDALIIPVPMTSDADGLAGLARDLDQRLDGALASLAADARFSGKVGTTFVLPTLGRLPARRIILAGVGDPDANDPDAVRRAYASATKAARAAGARAVTLAVPSVTTDTRSEALTDAAEGAQLALYEFTKYYGTGQRNGTRQSALTALRFIASEDAGLDQAKGQAALDRARAIATGVTLARDLVNEPASVLHPAEMAIRALVVADAAGVEATVLESTQLAELGAGAILAVGRGSAIGPRMIHLIYRPAEGIAASGRRIGLVGKCITFDTGGYSIKTGEGMLDMKVDMAGGAAVLGVMSALTALECPHEVHGVICAAENMISGEAFRPGDILTAMNGVTIEILSTDAEGRLVLADGLVYTARQGVEEMIDLATLTGAAVVALGDGTTALFSSDDELADRILTAADAVGEHTWRMPLTERHNDKIKGDVGDIKNSGGRQGGAITAALFLNRFREGLPWAHLDIAGSASAKSANGYVPKGGTGTGVRTLLRYLGA